MYVRAANYTWNKVSKRMLLCRWLLNFWHLLVVNWQRWLVSAKHYFSSDQCLLTRLLSCAWLFEHTCRTPEKDWIFEESWFLDWYHFPTDFALKISGQQRVLYLQMILPTVKREVLIEIQLSYIERQLRLSHLHFLRDDLSFSVELSRDWNNSEEGHWKDADVASLRNVQKYLSTSWASIVFWRLRKMSEHSIIYNSLFSSALPLLRECWLTVWWLIKANT